ncbi:hypothetical protein Poli38472_006643 [Pythium oligandrum]|uniref:AAA+ ATPase domain-containing protein n=1 Tax=Pythium oligandrum TaxID=41045 RepID=A0A8K1C5F4_PYTOL|nr:hypothetical protein Poli38472_006643 [Pythium oligandrum]|eukprot:TMW56633.1 hypothetical protein Poli38472_006643 [Pythium oligandrum]
MVDARCATSSTLLHCDSTIEWKCGSGRHNFDIAVCKHGPPTMCPSCSFDLLEEELAATQSICDLTAEDIPWPPLGGPLKISWPTFASPIELSEADKIEFYTRKLILLEGFKRWVTKSKDEWSRAVFRPQIIPVFTIRKSVTRNPTELGRVEVKDFASNKSWNSIDVHEWTNANTNFMLPPARSTHQVIFGYLFSLGVNSSPSDAPTGKFGAGHLRWIESQQNAFGYDCAFLAKKKNGLLGEEGTIRVWDPFVIAPCAEARVSAGQRDMVLKQAAPERTYWSTASRFVEYDRAAMLDTEQAGDNGVAGAAFSVPSVPTEYLEKLHQVLAALTYPWAVGIHTVFPWLGKQLFLGGETLPESVERQLREKLGFMRQGTAPPAKKIGPFAGRRFMQQVVKQQPFAEAELFHALELLWIQKENVTEATTLLESYATKMTGRGKACHPLLLLALARLTARLKAAVKPSELFELFRQLYPEATELWMTREELEGMGVPADDDLSKKSISDPVSMTPAEQWEKLKTESACKSKAMEELLKMVGLTKVKRFAIQLFKSAVAFQRMTPEKRKKNAITQNFCFLGNPGTGKTTVAKLFAQILHDSGMRRNGTAELCTAQAVKDAGSDAFRDQIKKAMGGVIFIDEVYELDPMNDPKGKPIVAELLVAAEDKRDDLSVIIAGYEDDIQQKLYAFNDGIRSRFIEVTFDDFDEADLRIIWDGLLRDREWTSDENAGVVACRRLARCAGRKGFGNARAVRQVFERVTQEAMSREDFDGIMELRTIDVIGERPTKNPKLQLVMRELDGKIGWKRIKQRIRELIDICDKNYERELKGIDVIPVLMNRLFLGNPGTGKTTCAGIYGRILKQLGFLSNGDVVKKTAGDFVGQHIGQSQTKTNDILKQAQGKVLLIDEAYNLDDQWYGKQVLDVLVEKVQGTDSDDIAVLMLGYEHQMKEMLRTQNPGLKRRFPIEYAFYFDDYDDQEMLDIFMAACKRKSVRCSMDVAEAVIAQLSMQRHQANFGNAGAVELILKSAMANASMRPLVNDMIVLELADVENETLKRAKEDEGKAQGVEADDPLRLLDGLYRMENIKHELQRLSTRIQVAQQEGEEVPEIGHFVFRGSPGTGKTTVARAMGKILHRMGLLGSDKVVETSGLDMTGEYVGQTKKRVEEQLGQARGAILFIDEAYELGKGHYGEEAMTSLVAAMTDPRYVGMVVIIAGYPADLDEMLNRNAGLKSRFTRFLDFRDWETHDCLEFITGRSNRAEYRLMQDTVDCLRRMFEKLRSFPGFGNGRDVDKVWKSLLECRAQRVLGKPELERLITLDDANGAWQQVLGGRAPPIAKKLTQPVAFSPDVKFLDAGNQPPLPRVEHSHKSTEQPNAREDEEPETKDEPDEYELERVTRDAGVDDAVWEELERAKEAYAQLLRDMKDAEDRRKRDEARRKLEKERAMQTKLRKLCLCPAGFQWHRCGGGWRCGGGSHFVSNEELERKFMV